MNSKQLEEYVRMVYAAKTIISFDWKPKPGDIIHVRSGTKYKYSETFLGGKEAVLEDSFTDVLSLKDPAISSYGFDKILEIKEEKYLFTGIVFSEDPSGTYYKLKDIIWLPRANDYIKIYKKKANAYLESFRKQGHDVRENYTTFEAMEAIIREAAYWLEKESQSPYRLNRLETFSIEMLYLAVLMRSLPNFSTTLISMLWNGKFWKPEEP